jgi:hypothetical protein
VRNPATGDDLVNEYFRRHAEFISASHALSNEGVLRLLNQACGVSLTSSPHCRSGYFFCLETKEAKFKSPPACFFAARGHYPAKSGSTTGCLHFALERAMAFASAKFKMPLPTHRLPCAARLSAEAGEDDESFNSPNVLKPKEPHLNLPGREDF